MRGLSLLLGIACLFTAVPAVAGAVYRCDTPDGARSYVSKRVPGARCDVVSEYRAQRHAPAPRGVSTPSTPSKPVTAVGAVTAPTAALGVAAAVPPSVPAAEAPAESPPAPAAAASGGTRGARLVQGEVYSYIQDGVRHYTSKRPANLAKATAVRTIKYSFMETCFACAAKPGVNFGKIRLNLDAYRDEITVAAATYGVDEAIVRAIIHAESAFNPNALSRVGAQGLMQLMPATAKRFGVSNAFDPAQNIRGGVQYLSWLLKRFNGDLTLAAAGYNAGEGAVDKYKGVPPYSETRRYVERVNLLADRYRGSTVTR